MEMTTETAVLPELGLRIGNWTIDHPHSSLHFSIRHLGLARVRGRFDRFDGLFVVGPTLAETRVEAKVDLASINTNNADRDAHLRSTDFFSTGQHPEMSFVSAAISPAGGEWQVVGALTLNGLTRPFTLTAEFNGVERFPGRDARHAGFSASGSLHRSEFGIEFGLMPISVDALALSDEVKIELDVEFIEPRPAAPLIDVGNFATR